MKGLKGITLALGLLAAQPLTAQTTTDYDTNDNGLIEIRTLAQLNAIRWDLDGNGDPVNASATAYGNAFPNRDTNAATRMGCPETDTPSDNLADCTGYELMNDLDFDENGDGQITQAGDPTYWNSGAGWQPIGNSSNRLSTTFDGNG